MVEQLARHQAASSSLILPLVHTPVSPLDRRLAIPGKSSMWLMARAGLPTTTAPGGTSRVTTAPAPIKAGAPIVTPGSSTAPAPTIAPASMVAPRRVALASRERGSARW